MVTTRDRNETVIVGDSGGYQIQTEKIEFDPATTPQIMLRWLEQVADWSMVLEFPTGGSAAAQCGSTPTGYGKKGTISQPWLSPMGLGSISMPV